MQRDALMAPPCTVTATYPIKLFQPTPADTKPAREARAIKSTADRARVEGSLSADGTICATCTGTFGAAKPGHAAYHRW
ncbi:MAG: hypothetical protein ABI420_14345 [Opitutaceae bacterium]